MKVRKIKNKRYLNCIATYSFQSRIDRMMRLLSYIT